MPYKPLKIRSDQWLWDFWIVPDNSHYHLYYLHAPKSIKDPEQRHWNVAIGHAISLDLHQWDILDNAINPGPQFDRYTWTGSTLKYGARWYLFYTYTLRQEQGLIQRISVATSSDTITWECYPKPIIEADERWYELLDLDIWCDQAWRDPWVFKHPKTDDFYALITARVNYGDPATRGVIGLARSQNLFDWEVLPPITKPGKFGVMECPQIECINNLYYLIFSAPSPEQESGAGTYYMMADNPLGPFENAKPLCADVKERFYAGKLVQKDGKWYFMAWRHRDIDGNFIGDLIEPQLLTIGKNSELLLVEANE